jgi:phosphoribosyl 1,2-cyclic phosphate phosphodiesterase
MGMVHLEFLGTGTSQGVPVVGCDCPVCTSTDPRDKRLRSSVLVKSGGSTVLIDAGPDLRQQMLRSKVRELDAVLLTHEHMDHIAGIDELRAFNFRQQRAMDIHASPATNAAVRRMFHYAFAEHRYPGVPELRLHDIGAGAFEAGGLEVIPIPVLHHLLPVLGFRIGGLAYITDAKTVPPASMELLKGIDVLVVNALRKKEHLSHLNLTEAVRLVQAIGPRQAWFIHMSHLMGTHAEVDAELPGGIALAYDGLHIEARS